MSTFIGNTIYVATALPAANNTGGFEALTWVQVKGLITLPQLGVTHSMIDVPDLATGFTKGEKGAAQGVDTSMTFSEKVGDTGQDNVRTQAEGSSGIISIKIVEGTGTDSGDGPAPVTGDKVRYAQGVVKDYQENQGDDNSFKGFQVGFRQNDFTVPGTQPA
jgi:hypothetical protein